ncbi:MULTISPECIES: ribosome maturation factor RimP [unclassified Actinomyces]|uniref:ribosome maturation factor RimP n=1 Tax=unclassified Actinomyces TaxID=2609248 RepID=UPI002016DFCC|nr:MULTISPECIES: ribosome maturation factor RimP [unclassified Actinomyces]MCL3778583.1 ribosome maturation factor RimP [Actinomyces sp. AC-20-1]MCL3789608.1 ribosome maturation factor RimP [Actinomyces sp. 187325]MCL3792231.1 ribosome maturation factor RimP [Actinomyces sp. 186855]MCL3794539.1 ribosome maturation factor RimP [Actinomyces sp. 217892]
MADALATRLTELLAPVVEGAGLFLEGVETTRAGRYSTVRVVVDLPDGEGDIDLDTVAAATQAVSEALDAADPVKGQYTLEVLSPGAERPLTTPRHFRRAVGRTVAATTAGGTLTGTLVATDEDGLTIDVDGAATTLALGEVTEARTLVVL